MKIQTSRHFEYGTSSGNLHIKKNPPAKMNFAGNLPIEKTPFIDRLIKTKFSQKVFNLASLNPHTFCLAVMAVIGIAMRPATILVTPGAKKEDKQYAAAKSIIGTTIVTATHLALFIPLGNIIKKHAIEAMDKKNNSGFPKINTPKFEAYNYLVNNGVAVILSVALAMATVKTITKIMNIILPDKKNKLPKNNFDNIKMSTPSQNTLDDFIQRNGAK